MIAARSLRRAGMPKRRSARQREQIWQGYAYLSPWLIGFLAFTVVPVVTSILLSFTRYSVLRPPQFVGMQNFRRAFLEDKLMWWSLERSFYYALLLIPLGLTANLVFAVLLNQHLRVTSLWRTFFFLPTLTPS